MFPLALSLKKLVMVSNYQHVLINGVNLDAALALWARSSDASVFNHPGFWRALEEANVLRGKIVSIEVRSGHGELLALWPFVLRRGHVRDLYCRISEPVGSRHADYVSPLIASGTEEEVIPNLIDGIEELFARAGRLYIPKLMANKAYAAACQDMARKGYITHIFTSPSQRLRFGTSYAETEKALGWSKKHLPSARIRRLQREGMLELWLASDRKQIVDRLDILYGLHLTKWRRAGFHSQFNDDQNRRLFELWVKYLPLDLLHYSELRLNEQVISAHFGFMSEGWLYWYKPAYDIAFEKLSPGVAHIALLAQMGIGLDWKGIDFLQGDEAYKSRWSNDEQNTIYIRAATMRGIPWLLWERSIRGWFRGFAINPLRRMAKKMRKQSSQPLA